MRRKRAKHNVWDKRIVPILVASILLFTLMKIGRASCRERV